MNFNSNDFVASFLAIILEALPFIVIGALVSGVLEELLPQKFFTRWLPKNRTLAIVGSSLMGLVMPMCECGIVPVMRRLLRKGVPASCAVTYMLSAPGMNFIVLSSTGLAFWGFYDLFGIGGFGMILMRGGMAFVTAVTVGLVIERMSRKGIPLIKEGVSRVRLIESDESTRLLEEDHVFPSTEVPPLHDHEDAHPEKHDHVHQEGHEHSGPPRTLLDRLTAIADIALGDFVDIAAFLVIGAALAAAVNTAIEREQIEQLADQQTLSIMAMMGLAMLLSLCSEADAFVAANFTALGTGAKLGFLVVGPMLDVKLYIMYRWVFTRRAVGVMIAVLLVLIFMMSSLVGLFSLD